MISRAYTCTDRQGQIFREKRGMTGNGPFNAEGDELLFIFEVVLNFTKPAQNYFRVFFICSKNLSMITN